MKNERLEKNKEILKQYNDIKTIIWNDEHLKYKWYLELEKILFNYLGVNKYRYASAKEYRNFPITFYEDYYTEEEAKEIINETADFLEILEISVNELLNNIKLNQYEESSLYKNIYFNIPNYIDYYKGIELVSITFKPCPKIRYEVKESEGYDMKCEIKDKTYYYKRVNGRFLKENINFNMNVNYIESIEIDDNNELKNLTVSQFNKKYKDLNGFLYKELNSSTIRTEDTLVNNAIKLLSKFINVRTLPPIKFVEKLPAGCRGAIGVYYFDSIYVTTKPTYTSKLEILIHELGHYIHRQYFNDKQFRFSTKGKSKYANKNCRENFAECFTELIYHKEDTERTRKMIKILSEII